MDEMLELVTCRLFVAAGESSIYCSSGRSCFLPIIACIQLAYSCKQHRCLSCSSQSMQMRMPLCSGLSILLNLLQSLQPRELLASCTPWVIYFLAYEEMEKFLSILRYVLSSCAVLLQTCQLLAERWELQAWPILLLHMQDLSRSAQEKI